MTPSARTLDIAAPLRTYPRSGVIIPLVACVRNRAQRCFDVVPSPFVVEGASDQSRYERTPSSRPRPAIQVFDKIGIKLYVYSHVL